ncbi:vesicular-fusion protein S17 [Kappamyces sp. JEL0680]|nr:vesicular-fusion protein S17 [Kappamyces sp. JEL0680]
MYSPPAHTLVKESGDAFMEQGKTLEKLGERDESSGCYLNAAKSYKKEFPKGRFSTAANNQKQIAEIYEQDIGDMKAAMDAYETAAEWYSGEDSNAQANQCLLKVAQFAGTLEEYERAVDLFERVAAKSLDNNLTKWSVREYLFKAFICVLCINDSVRSKSTLDKYLTMDPSFKGTRECALCTVGRAAWVINSRYSRRLKQETARPLLLLYRTLTE